MTDKPIPGDELDPRVGWLISFFVAANHPTYASAARELGTHPDTVQRQVEKLERWLHKVLIDDSGTLNFPAPDGVSFLAVASALLVRLSKLVGAPVNRNDGFAALPRAIKGLTLSDLKAVAGIQRHINFKELAADIGVTVDQARRKVRNVEKAFSTRFYTGHARLKMTDLGVGIAGLADEFADGMLASRADMSNYDPIAIHLRTILRFVNLQISMIRIHLQRLNSRTSRDFCFKSELTHDLGLLEGLRQHIWESGRVPAPSDTSFYK